MTRLLVIGGGIAGLAAAWEWVHSGRGEVTLVERSDRLGGKIGTEPFAGVDLDIAADSFLARVPAATTLAHEVGLGDELVAPATGQAYLWARGRLRPLPSGLVLGVPTDLRALGRSRVLSRGAVARAALDLVLPGRPVGPHADISVGELIGRRLGRAVQLGLVDPLIGGINAGHTDALSAEIAAPQLLAAARRDRSLIRGLRAAPVPPSGDPVFLTVRGGMARLVEATGRAVAAGGARIVLSDAVTKLTAEGAQMASGAFVRADAVVLACPPAAAAAILAEISPDASAALRAIKTSSVVLTTLSYATDAVPMLTGSGFLVPRSEQRLLTACTWVDTKWPHLATPGRVVLRASAGRVDDERAMAMDDDALVGALHDELAEAMGLRAGPVDHRVHRWRDAFPQYAVGHLAAIDAIERRLAIDAPHVALAGAALRGVGVATCIAGGRTAAARVLAAA